MTISTTERLDYGAGCKRLSRLVRQVHARTTESAGDRDAPQKERIASAELLLGRLRDLNHELVAVGVQLAVQQLEAGEPVPANALLQITKLVSGGATARISGLENAVATLKLSQQ